MTTEQISLRLPRKLMRELRAESQEKKLSITAIVIDTLSRAFDVPQELSTPTAEMLIDKIEMLKLELLKLQDALQEVKESFTNL